VYLRSSLD
jgi:Ca2+-binding EF-hand superfamily protein